MGIDSGARSSDPRSPKTRGKIETVTMWPRLAAGLPSLPPDASRRVRFDQSRGRSEEHRSMTGEDPDPTAHAIARMAGQAVGLRSSSRSLRRVSDNGSPSLHLDASRDASVSDVCSLPSFDFQRRAPGWCPARDPILSWRSGEAPRHAASASLWFERALSRALIEPGSGGSHHLSRDVLPADLPSLARAADRSETPIDRAPDESRWDRLTRSPGQREPLRES